MARKKAVFDPLSETAIPAESAEGVSEPFPAPAEATAPVPPPKVTESVADPKVKVIPPHPPIQVYRVVEKKKIPWKGQWLVMNVGKEVSEASHGPNAIELMEACGLKLEKVG